MPFKKGKSGNPGGRARGYQEFAARAREMSAEGLEQLYAFARDKRLGVPVRILAWKTIFERGFGKAVQPVALGLEALGGQELLVIRLPPLAESFLVRVRGLALRTGELRRATCRYRWN